MMHEWSIQTLSRSVSGYKILGTKTISKPMSDTVGKVSTSESRVQLSGNFYT